MYKYLIIILITLVFLGCAQRPAPMYSQTNGTSLEKKKAKKYASLYTEVNKHIDISNTPKIPELFNAMIVDDLDSLLKFSAQCTYQDSTKEMNKFFIDSDFYTSTAEFYKDNKSLVYSHFIDNNKLDTKAITCIPKSKFGHNIFPIEAFNDTISLKDNLDVQKKMYNHVAKQISKKGRGYALLVFYNGNAFEVAYNNNKSHLLEYSFKFHKKGEYDSSKFAFIGNIKSFSTTKYADEHKKPYVKFIDSLNLENDLYYKYYLVAKNTNTINGYKKFIKKHTKSRLVAVAQQDIKNLKEQQLFKKLIKTDNIDKLRKFLQEYENSIYKERVQNKIYQLENKVIVSNIQKYLVNKNVEGLITYITSNPNVEKVAMNIPRIALLFSGPKNLMVINLLNYRKKGLGDIVLASKIKSLDQPYRDYSFDEMLILKKYGLSDIIISAMMDVTSAYKKEMKRKNEQNELLMRQDQRAKQMENSQKKALANIQKQQENLQKQQEKIRKENKNAQQANKQENSIGNAMSDALIKKGTEKIAEKLWDSLF